MPNFQDRVIQGSGTRGNVGTYKTESLPNITGHTNNWIINAADSNGFDSLYTLTRDTVGSNNVGLYANANTGRIELYLDASRSSSTYKNSAPVQQNALLIQCCIKY